MSTLMSRDLNLVRPSTLVHAPPGGKTSISFSDGSATEPYPSSYANNKSRSKILNDNFILYFI